MTRRIVTFAVALLLAVAGAIGVLDYAHQANQRALNGLRTVSAYVATRQIPAGASAETAVKDGLLVPKQFPESTVPADAVSSVTPSSGVLTSDLGAGQMLLSPMLGASAQTASALPIPPGMEAVALQFCAQSEVANYVSPGSQVDVFSTFVNGRLVTGACSGVSTAGAQPQTRLVLKNVLVLAVGEGTATAPSSASATADGPTTSSGSSAPSTVYITLAVPQIKAETLIELGESGSPYLALVTSASQSNVDIQYQP